ncbi:MAG: succinate dehydrogenase, cytochrome b556 subunit [Methylocystis sp.]
MIEAERETLAERRPLSPYLSVYRVMLTMVMSMAHRVTGVALYLGAALLAIYFAGLAAGPSAYSNVSWIVDGVSGKIILVGFVWALYHHLLGGIRHALWDRGILMGPVGREALTQATLVGGVALTTLTFYLVTLVRPF